MRTVSGIFLLERGEVEISTCRNEVSLGDLPAEMRQVWVLPAGSISLWPGRGSSAARWPGTIPLRPSLCSPLLAGALAVSGTGGGCKGSCVRLSHRSVRARCVRCCDWSGTIFVALAENMCFSVAGCVLSCEGGLVLLVIDGSL